MIALLLSCLSSAEDVPGSAVEPLEGKAHTDTPAESVELLVEPLEPLESAEPIDPSPAPGSGSVEVRPAPDGRLVVLVDWGDLGAAGALLALLVGGLGALRRYGPAMPAADRGTREVVTASSSAILEAVLSIQQRIDALEGSVAELQMQEEHNALTVASALDTVGLALEQGRLLIDEIPRWRDQK